MSVHQLKVWYDAQRFLSHARAARDYQLLLRSMCQVVTDPAAADIVVLHHEPRHYKKFLQEVPALSTKYIIGFGVWEADRLPKDIAIGCQFADEIWTASWYCWEVFRRSHERVTWMPHVVLPPPTTSHSDDEILGKLFDRHSHAINFLTVTQERISRKNTPLLMRAFNQLSQRAPDARLIIKSMTYPHVEGSPVSMSSSANMAYITGKMPEGAFTALMSYCDAYVSAHASEGWGLPLSDAMMARKPVIATGYSGNMDFMTPHNAYLVDYTIENIHPADVYYLFTTDMRWAYPHRESLENQLWLAYQQIRDGSAMRKVAQAYQDIQNYNVENVSHRLHQRLSEIQAGLADGSLQTAASPPGYALITLPPIKA